MKSFKYIASSLIIAASAFLPVVSAHAAGGNVTFISSYVDSTSAIKVKGEASAGTDVVSISVYNSTGEMLVVGPENTETDSSYQFTYSITGSFDTNATYTVCAADYDGGTQTCNQTVKVIKTVDLTVEKPVIGETVTLDEYGLGDKIPAASASGDVNYKVEEDRWWALGSCNNNSFDCYEGWGGTFKADENYYASIDVTAKDGYIFADDVVVKVNGVVSEFHLWPGGDGMVVVAKLNVSTEDEKKESSPNTGIAPKASDNIESEGVVKKNISLGVSVIIASAITYAAYLINKRKANRK